MRAGSRKGLTLHSVSVRGVAAECLRQATESVENSAFYQPFLALTCGTAEEIKDLQSRAAAAIKDSVQVGLRLLGDFLQKEYESWCRPEIAASSLPRGQQYYKVGQIKILELRKRAERELGQRFDIRTFHDIVLDCAGPLDILETKIDQYIQSV